MAKNETVSKKELEDSGYVHLQDYLNAKRGLKRKDGRLVEMRPGREGKDSELGVPMSAAESSAAMDRMAPKSLTRDVSMDAKSGMQSADMADAMRQGYADSPAPTGKRTDDRPFAERYLGRPSKEERAANREGVSKFIKDKLGFKKGGSVSSASSRADGCAVKGKTRGRFV
jgi:hypothetical protein